MLPCLLAHALGANLTNTVLSSQLSQLAPPGKTAEYMSIIGTFASLGTVRGITTWSSVVVITALSSSHHVVPRRCARATSRLFTRAPGYMHWG